MITYEMSLALGGVIYWIQSVFVVQEARKKGVFRKLYNRALEIAKQDTRAKCMRLYVELENTVAQTVYEHMGMDKFDTYEFNEVDEVFSH